MNRAPKSTEAFDELVSALQEIRDGYVLDEQRFTDDIDVVEAFRYVTHVVSGASEFFIITTTTSLPPNPVSPPITLPNTYPASAAWFISFSIVEVREVASRR